MTVLVALATPGVKMRIVCDSRERSSGRFNVNGICDRQTRGGSQQIQQDLGVGDVRGGHDVGIAIDEVDQGVDDRLDGVRGSGYVLIRRATESND